MEIDYEKFIKSVDFLTKDFESREARYSADAGSAALASVKAIDPKEAAKKASEALVNEARAEAFSFAIKQLKAYLHPSNMKKDKTPQ